MIIISSLETMVINIENGVTHLPIEDRGKAIPSKIIAKWTMQDIERVEAAMPVIGWRRLNIGGENYWINPFEYNVFLKNIERVILT